MPSSPRSAETSSLLIGLPREESRCLLQDLALLTQPRVVAPQPAQLLPLITGQALALARVDLRLAEPVTQRLRRDAQLAASSGNGSPLERASRTASARNSGGYGGLVFDTSTPSCGP